MMDREALEAYLKKYKGIDLYGLPIAEFSDDETPRRVFFEWVPLLEERDLEEGCQNGVYRALLILAFPMRRSAKGVWERGENPRPVAALRIHHASSLEEVIRWLKKVKKHLLE